MKKLTALLLVLPLLLALFACGKAYVPLPNPPLVLGEKYLLDLDYEQAVLQFEQAIKIDPKNPRGYLGKADALLHLNRQADAVSTLGIAAAQCRPQRAALSEVKAKIEKSLIDGYIGIASAYEKLGWQELALALLRRVCEELPEESRLKEALERLQAAILAEMLSNYATTAQAQEEIPVNVFTTKDLTPFGLTENGDLDIYAIAAKYGFSRSEVEAAKQNIEGNGDVYPYLGFHEIAGQEMASYKLSLNCFPNTEAPYVTKATIIENVAGITLPGGVRIGMRLDEVLDCFYCPPEKKAEVARSLAAAGAVEDYDNNREKYKVILYQFGSFGNITADFFPECYNRIGGLTYHYLTDDGNHYAYFIAFQNENRDRVSGVVIQLEKLSLFIPNSEEPS